VSQADTLEDGFVWLHGWPVQQFDFQQLIMQCQQVTLGVPVEA
jgi:hypothetical protein